MAERRMFSKQIVDSDAFYDMPLSAQALYFHLNMNADDDGFLNNAKKICRQIGAKSSDYELLLSKHFIILLENDLTVIKHWKMNNYIQSDRYRPTVYQTEFNALIIKENKSYAWIQNGYNVSEVYTQVSKGKVSKGKASTGNIHTREEIVDPFIDFSNNDLELATALKDFSEMRIAIKKPLTINAKKLLITKLTTMKMAGQDIVACIKESVMNNWAGVFDMKVKTGNYTKPQENKNDIKPGEKVHGRVL